MKRVISTLLVAVFALGVSFEAKAWGTVAHHAAVYMAQQNLTPETKKEIRKYLDHTLTYYATWMDHYRTTIPYEPLDWWHNVAVDEKNNIIELDGHSGYVQLTRIMEEMKDYKNLPDSLVRQNLIYLIHMVPDYHCPVHTFFRKGYHTERKYTLKQKGKKFSLHTFWDRSPGFRRTKWTMEKYAKEVDVLSPKEVKKIQKGDPIKWAQDAVKQANRVYDITPADIEVTKLSKEKTAEIHKLSDEMILKGAYRLAYIINDIFKE